MNCRISGEKMMGPIIDLGDMYVSDFVPGGQERMVDKAPLRLGLGSSGLLQLMDSYPPEKMYSRYWYSSGVNEAMREALENVVHSASKWVDVTPGCTVLDIASNDGTLLEFYPANVERVGVDPSDIAAKSKAYGDGAKPVLINDFFSAKGYKDKFKNYARVVTVIAMFYDLEHPARFLREVEEVMEDGGLLLIQMSYMPLMLRQNAFDNIGHEHLAYYALRPLKDLLEQNGFRVLDAELNDVNCGSIRVYACKKGCRNDQLSAPVHLHDLGQHRIAALLMQESAMELNSFLPYLAMMKRVDKEREKTIAWLKDMRSTGQRVYGYGASTKGNTLLQYYGIESDLLECIVERSPDKVGRVTSGTGIPIISESAMRRYLPDYLLVLPWTFIQGMMQREADLVRMGTRFVVPLPTLTIMGSPERVAA